MTAVPTAFVKFLSSAPLTCGIACEICGATPSRYGI